MFSFLTNPGNSLECDGLPSLVTALQERSLRHVTKRRQVVALQSLTVVYLVCWVAQYLDWTNVMAPIAETQSVMAPNEKAPNEKVQI